MSDAETHFDQNDPLAQPKYMPRWYPVNVLFETDSSGGVTAGQLSDGSVTINNADFLLRKITAAVVGFSNIDYTAASIPPGSSALDAVVNPVGFQFKWYTDSHSYMTQPCDIVAAVGSAQFTWKTPSPVLLMPKATASFDVTNTLPRSGSVLLQFVLHGVEPAAAYPRRY